MNEGYIKAVGIGLGFELQQAQFTLNHPEKATTATVALFGKPRPEWKFGLHHLDNHIISVAIGPCVEAIESYRKTLSTPNKTSVDESAEKHILEPFQVLSINDLLPK